MRQHISTFDFTLGYYKERLHTTTVLETQNIVNENLVSVWDELINTPEMTFQDFIKNNGLDKILMDYLGKTYNIKRRMI